MGRKIEWIERDSVGKNRNRVLKHIFDDIRTQFTCLENCAAMEKKSMHKKSMF